MWGVLKIYNFNWIRKKVENETSQPFPTKNVSILNTKQNAITYKIITRLHWILSDNTATGIDFGLWYRH